jgi:conjugative relaxase-like TrwC/TraI family protein
MVRNKQFRSQGGKNGTARYFTDHLSTSDYYSKGQGILRGKTFEHMELSKREMTYEVFASLEKNLHPETGASLTPRTNRTRQEWGINPKTGKRELQTVDNRRPGLDLPFVVPKTLSEVMAENPGQVTDAIEKICVSSMDKAMQLAESLAKTRVRIAGAQDDRATGNMLYLSVIHRDARPVGTNVADPYWHCHNFIFNVTFDPVEKRLKAVQLHDVLKHADTIDAYFLSEIERGLTKLGIGTERTPDGRSFEVTSVKGKEIFSKRRNEIFKHEIQNSKKIETLTQYRLMAAAKMGKTLDYEKVKTEIRNEQGKQLAQGKKVLSLQEKLAALRAQMTPEIRESLQWDAATSAPRRNWRTPDQAKEEVLHSAFKQKSVVHEMALAGELLRATGGAMRLDEAIEYARSSAFIRLGDGIITTEHVKQEEVRMRETCRDGWDQYEPIISDTDREIRDPLVSGALDQANATRFIWNSRDLVTDVSGLAGAGKSTMLKEVIPAIKETGRPIVLLAPTSASENNLHKDFPEAITLQKFEADIEREILHLQPGTVIMLDEVSMVSVPQLGRLVDLVKDKQFRLVTLGDSDQHHSVERGDAIRILQDSKSIRSVQLTETYRAQVQYLKESVLDLKAGGDRCETAFNRLDEHGDIREIQDIDELRAAAVETHLDAVRSGYLAILASPVHAEARAAAAIVRETLKSEGLIEQEDHTITRLTRLDVDGLELRDPLHYQEGRVVSFHCKAAGGFKPGQKWRVKGLDGETIQLERDGITKTFNPRVKGKWSVYDTEEIVVSVGDQVRLTESFQERGAAFKNNDIAKVAAIDADRITLDDGRSLRRDYLHLDQGVCITSYASECRTVRQMVAIAPLSSFSEMDQKAFYVLASRATHKAIFYTDCKEALREAALRPGDRQSVWEYQKTANQVPTIISTVKKTPAMDLQMRANQEREQSQGMER